MKIKRMFDVRTPMRDGVELSSDIWLPQAPGQYPLILVRTPYLKATELLQGQANYFVSRGYAIAFQDVRGRGDSDGIFNSYFQEGQDGYDSIEGLAAQPWCNGDVGMMGVSYLSIVQWLTAKERPPHLRCITPTSGGGDIFSMYGYVGGALYQTLLSYYNSIAGRIDQSPNALDIDWDEIYQHKPLIEADSLLGRKLRLFREQLQHPTRDEYWQAVSYTAEDYQNLDIPIMYTSSWFDSSQVGTFYNWENMHKHNPDNDHQYLTIGTWDHTQNFTGGTTQLGELTFTPDAVIDNKKMHLEFFDHYLKRSTTELNMPRVRFYITGINAWRYYDQYPIPGTVEKRLFLGSGGKANSLYGDGTLSWQPKQTSTPDRFTYNPENPVRYNPDRNDSIANDLRPMARRDDILVYTSEILIWTDLSRGTELSLRASTIAFFLSFNNAFNTE